MIKNKHGFTLIELLAVIVILGLLALIVTPGISKVIRNSKINTAKTSLEGYVREIENASALYMTDTGKYPTSIDVLELDGKNISKIENPIVELSNGGVVKVTAEIDGLYCVYKDGKGAECSEEPIIEYAGTLSKDFYEKSGRTDRSVISSLIFYSDARTLEGEVYDVSEAQDGKILMYVNTNSEDTNLLDLTIVGDGIIYLPADSSRLFSFGTSFICSTPPYRGYTDYILFNDSIDTSRVTNMSGMFYATGSSSEEFTLDLGDKFDTSNVTDMSSMFEGTGYSNPNFTLDLGDKFDTSNVTNMSYMFNKTGYSSEVFTLDLGDKFDTSNVTDMSYMFSSTGYSNPNFTLDLGDKFDTSNVTNMSFMISSTGYCSKVFTLDLGDKFDTSNVTNMSRMFLNTGLSNPNFTLDLSGFNTSNVTNMLLMFGNLSNLKTIYVGEEWTTDAVTSSSSMFKNCTSLPNFNSSVVDKTNAHYGEGGYLTLKNNT